MRGRACAILAIAAVLASLALAACGTTAKKKDATGGGGGSTCSSGGGTAGKQPQPLKLNVAPVASVTKLVPAALQGKTLSVASDASYAPNEFKPVGKETIIGMDVDLANAIGQTMGVKVKFVDTPFATIITALSAHRANLGISSLTDNKTREKTVDFVTYFQAGVSIMAPKCNPHKVKTQLDLCGLKVGAENGTVELDTLQNAKDDSGNPSLKTRCTKAGKKAPQPHGYENQTDVNQALAAGRIDAYLADTPVVDYQVKATGGEFSKVGNTTDVAPYGIAVPKDAGTLKDALLAGLKTLIGNGDYTKILANWGVQSGAITSPVINGATS
jgi:polar amino acid transport system substrate-binding protein